MSDNVVEDETGRSWKVDDELSEGDFVLTQSPAVMGEHKMPTVKISVEQRRDIDEDYVYLRKKSGGIPKFRITHVIKNGKPVNYSGCDRMRMIQDDEGSIL